MAKSQTFQKNYIRCGSRVVGLWNVGVGFRYCIDIFGANHWKWHTINLNYAILLFLRFELFEKSLRKFYSKLVFVMISKTINLFFCESGIFYYSEFCWKISFNKKFKLNHSLIEFLVKNRFKFIGNWRPFNK